MKKLNLMNGRLSFYAEPRDIWVGVYVAESYIYILPLPMLVIRWERQCSWEDPCDAR